MCTSKNLAPTACYTRTARRPSKLSNWKLNRCWLAAGPSHVALRDALALKPAAWKVHLRRANGIPCRSFVHFRNPRSRIFGSQQVCQPRSFCLIDLTILYIGEYPLLKRQFQDAGLNVIEKLLVGAEIEPSTAVFDVQPYVTSWPDHLFPRSS